MSLEVVRDADGQLVADDGQVIPRWPCQCGGRYCLGYGQGTEGLASDGGRVPMLVHTLPWCARYVAVDTTEQAVAFSRENREALAS